MRRPKLYSTVALLGLTGLVSEAHAQPRDVRAIKPLMMLLVDTSGSMEYRPDTATETNKLPTCTNTTSDEAQKNRWAVTLEALTGTFSTFRCVERQRSHWPGAFDENYFLPHFDFSGSPSQSSDGVLDAFKTRLKFGLMTFDGVLTTVDGDTHVPYASFANSSTVRDQILGRAGMYSYPDTTEDESGHGWMELFYKGCTTYYGVNAGARGKGTEPGSLISVGLSDAASDVQVVNANIQKSLLDVRPYGGTPIAAMLDDLRYYLKNDADVKRNSDPYFTCRKRFAVLLTDGAPDSLFRGGVFNCDNVTEEQKKACKGDDCCPYGTPESVAKKLVREDGLDKLWVVAFNVNDSLAMQHLNAIAEEGAKDDLNNKTAINAQTPAALRAALTNVMNLAQPDATSRSVPVMADNGKLLYTSGGKQFEIVAGFKIGAQDDEPWEGTLFRRRTVCEGSSPVTKTISTSEKDAFHVELNAQSAANERVIHTVHPTVTAGVSAMRGTLYGRASNSIDSTAFNLTASEKINTNTPAGNTFGATVPTDSTATVSQTRSEDDLPLATFGSTTPVDYFGDADRNGTAAEEADRNLIDLYLRGRTTNRVSRTLGDIYHSNPVVLPPLVHGSSHTETTDPALSAYYAMITDTTGSGRYDAAYGRPGVVFVGTNDGLLHAFNLDTWRSKDAVQRGAGHEFWSFTPPALFDKMAATVTPSHQIMFDGTPVVRDVIYKRASGTASYNSSEFKMGTVLIIGVRGAPAYVALDVTHPEEPKFLWQRSFSYLGNTIGQPEIAHVRINWNGSEQFRAVAILPGGEGEVDSSAACEVDTLRRAPNGRTSLRCWKVRGRSLYIVDVATGELIQEFDARHFHSPLTGSVAVDGIQLGASQAAYFTDEDGILHRLSMVNPDPRKWRVQPAWDLFAGEGVEFDGDEASMPTPTYSFGRVSPFPPMLSRDPVYGNLTILVGTGDVENLTDTAAHRVVSLKETRTYDTHSKELTISSDTFATNWVLQLDRGEAVTGPMVVWQDTVYLSTFRSNLDNLCMMGTNRIVGAHVRETESTGLPRPKLLTTTAPYQNILWYSPTQAQNSLLLGLSISREPMCVVGQADPTYAHRYKRTGAAGGGHYMLHSMIAGQDTTSATADTQISGAGGLRQLTQNLQIHSTLRTVGWASSVE